MMRYHRREYPDGGSYVVTVSGVAGSWSWHATYESGRGVAAESYGITPFKALSYALGHTAVWLTLRPMVEREDKNTR